jgi:dienelactone hydrolase
MVLRRLVTVVLAAVAAHPAAAAAAAPAPFGQLACAAQEGVRQCSGRVPTFDGVPLDLNVTLPATGDGNFPLIILSHGWGGQKFPLVDSDEPGNVQGSSKPWADRGYATLSVTSRGFNGSCGSVPSRAAVGCDHGWIRLDDTRYEIQDVQYLAGRLVDDGLVDPARIGVHGGSYGGGVSNALAVLRDRIMRTPAQIEASADKKPLGPWTSPKGRPISLAAAAPYIPWSDLVYSLMPNGRTLDYTLPRDRDSSTPAGVEKSSFVAGLYATGSAVGFYAPPRVDPDADLATWFARIGAGEPYDGDPVIADIADEIYTHHSSISLDRSTPPAPTFLASGWTDDLFPVDESIRLRNAILAAHPGTPVSMMFFDTGHQRGTNRKADMQRYRAHLSAWMDRYVKGDAGAQPLRGVETLTQTCPTSAPSGGPYTAPSWPEIRRGEVRFGDPAEQTLTNAGGDPDVARAIDPVGGGGNACAETSSSDESGTANYRLPAAGGRGYTLMGPPTVVADITTTGAFPQLNARLWDVSPEGKQTLVARTVYRPEASGRQVFQLHGNGWRFAPGHVAKLQLLGRDTPYARPSNGAFQVSVSELELRLPVVERPADNPVVQPPLPYALPEGTALAPGFSRAVPVSQTVRPSARGGSSRGSTRQRRRLYLVTGCKGVRLRGPDVKKVRRITIFRAGMKRRLDRRIPFRVRLGGGTGRRIRAVATLRDRRRVVLRAQLPRRCGSRAAKRR